LSLLDDHSRDLIELRGTWTTKAKRCGTTGIGLYGMRACRKPCSLDPRHSVVGMREPPRRDLADGVADAEASTALERITGIRKTREGGTLHGSRAAPQYGRPSRPANASSGWHEYSPRIHNMVRPHEALEMRLPASRWRRSARAYTRTWHTWAKLPQRSRQSVKVSTSGQIGRNAAAGISAILAGQRVEMVRLQDRVLVYHSVP